MAHEIDMSNGRANMAFVGETPWHGLGAQVPVDLPFERWAEVAGLNWAIAKSQVFFQLPDAEDGEVEAVPGRSVLYRTDTKAPLSIMSSERYKIVQPREIINFYEDLVSTAGFRLHTAGSLRGGQKIWALAETGREFRIQGQDRINTFLLLATSCDGTLATTAQFTSIRVVCNNTLTMAVEGKTTDAVHVSHATEFDPDTVKLQLGIVDDVTETFEETVTEMSKIKMSEQDAIKFLSNLLGGVTETAIDKAKQRTLYSLYTLYSGQGKGADLRSAQNTLWGAVNAVTEFYDHGAARTNDARLNSAWFGTGAKMKRKA